MKTDELVRLLATGTDPVPRHAAARRYAAVLVMGLIAAGLLMLGLLGVRPDLAEASRLPMFWIKIGYVACLAAASLLAVLRLSRPAAPLETVPAVLAVPVIAMWVLAAVVLADAEPGQGAGLLLGDTWMKCPPLIAALSLPAFGASLWAMRDLAPTRPACAGAAAGLLSGTVGALAYSLHCPEMGAPFIGSWYLLGMLIPAAAGGVLGPRLLRW